MHKVNISFYSSQQTLIHAQKEKLHLILESLYFQFRKKNILKMEGKKKQ